MLNEAGFNEDHPDALLSWETFKQFAVVPVECEEDDLLFQCGIYGQGEFFEFNFTRQFRFLVESGEYDGLEHLSYTLLYEPVGELRPLRTHLWDLDFVGPLHKKEFFEAVEALKEFRIVTAWHSPCGVETFQTPV